MFFCLVDSYQSISRQSIRERVSLLLKPAASIRSNKIHPSEPSPSFTNITHPQHSPHAIITHHLCYPSLAHHQAASLIILQMPSLVEEMKIVQPGDKDLYPILINLLAEASGFFRVFGG